MRKRRIVKVTGINTDMDKHSTLNLNPTADLKWQVYSQCIYKLAFTLIFKTIYHPLDFCSFEMRRCIT